MIRRFADQLVREALEDTPVVLIHGPRQTGKSTLAQSIGKEVGASYITLDDPIPRALAVEDPASLIGGHDKTLIIDEVQRAPQLFLALKASVDRDRRPGRFLLTGSANVLSLPKIADSLAGRIAIVDLQPLSQAEIESSESNFIDQVFGEGVLFQAARSEDLVERMLRGGFPEPFSRSKANRREAWFADYVRTLLERDVRDLTNIEGLAQMPRLLKLLAIRCGSAINVIDLSAEVKIPNTSLHRYLDLLQALFLTFQVPAWSLEESPKLAKSPKTYLVDSALLCHLRDLGLSSLSQDPDVFRSVLSNFVATELRKHCLVSEVRASLFHLRTVRRLEVDFVLQRRSGGVVGVQIVPSDHVLPTDLEGLQYLRELAGHNWGRGVLLYLGDQVQTLAEGLVALPISCLWQ